MLRLPKPFTSLLSHQQRHTTALCIGKPVSDGYCSENRQRSMFTLVDFKVQSEGLKKSSRP